MSAESEQTLKDAASDSMEVFISDVLAGKISNELISPTVMQQQAILTIYKQNGELLTRQQFLRRRIHNLRKQVKGLERALAAARLLNLTYQQRQREGR